MLERKPIVCLADSRKYNGKCVAGKVLLNGKPGEWIRPVSDREHQELSAAERKLPDGEYPRFLDIITIPLAGHQPRHHQTENHLIAPGGGWTRNGALQARYLDSWVDTPEGLWINNSTSSMGLFDRVATAEAQRQRGSLYFLHLERVAVHVITHTNRQGVTKRKVQAEFDWHGIAYRLWVTDIMTERRMLQMDNGVYAIGPAFATISLGEPWEGYCYKLVAALYAINSPERWR